MMLKLVAPPRKGEARFHAIEIFAAGNPAVPGQLVAQEQQDENGAGQSDRQPGDIDQAMQLVPRDAAKRCD